MSEARTPKPLNRFALIGIIITGVGIIVSLALIVLWMIGQPLGIGNAAATVIAIVGAILVPALYLVAILFGVLALVRRGRTVSGHGLAIAVVIISPVLLIGALVTIVFVIWILGFPQGTF